MKIFVNERMVDENKAVISVLDRGFLYGDGLFETMRSYKGEVLWLDRHLNRLYRSSEIIGMKINRD
ncbi:MAG: aminotransferase class IV, partial [Candidatus Omnitrophota bacterium]